MVRSCALSPFGTSILGLSTPLLHTAWLCGAEDFLPPPPPPAPPPPLPRPRVLWPLQALFEDLNFLKRTRSAGGSAPARWHLRASPPAGPRRLRAGSAPRNTFFHSSRSGTPLRSGDWSGRPLLGDARLLRGSGACQSPRAVKTSLPSLSQQSGVEAAAAAALPGAAAPRSAGRWRVRRAAGVRLRPPPLPTPRPRASGPPRRPARRRVPFVWRGAGVCSAFRTPPSPFRLCSLPPASPSRSRRRPPADRRPPGPKPADVSSRAMSPLQKVAAAAAPGR